jgi:hypothetical protein
MSFMAFLPEIIGAVAEGGSAAAGAGEAAAGASKFSKVAKGLDRAQEFHQSIANSTPQSQPEQAASSKPTQQDLHDEISNTMKGGI